MFKAGTHQPGHWRIAAIALVLILISWYWIHLVAIQPLAPPDFYRYYADYESIFQGNGGEMKLPPLYPLVAGLSGNALALLMPRRDAFILAGKLLSLLGAMGIFFAFLQLTGGDKPGKAALGGATFLVLSPMVLRFLALPLTDLVFLALLLGTFTALFRNQVPAAVVLALAAGGVRFEGFFLLLLVAAYILFHRNRLIWIPAALIIGADLLYLAARHTPRVLHYLRQWSLDGTPELWKNPQILLRVITGNLLFFLPSSWPRGIILTISLLFLGAVAGGCMAAWRRNPRAAAVFIAFILGMLLFKGYVVFEGNWRLHTRRLLPLLVPLLALAVIGIQSGAKWLKHSRRLREIVRIFLPLFTIPLVLLSPTHWPWWPVLLVLPVAALCLGIPPRRDMAGVAAALALAIFFTFVGGTGFRQAIRIVRSMPNEGGIAVARWFNAQNADNTDRILLMSNPFMVRYYLEKPARWEEWNPPHWRGRIPLEDFWSRFMSDLRNAGINRVVVDRYLPATSSRNHRSVKEMVWRRRGDPASFRVIRNLTDKGRLMAAVLEPVSNNSPEEESR